MPILFGVEDRREISERDGDISQRSSRQFVGADLGPSTEGPSPIRAAGRRQRLRLHQHCPDSYRPSACPQDDRCSLNSEVEENEMNLIIWLIIGGVIGWLASIIMGSPEGILLNIV